MIRSVIIFVCIIILYLISLFLYLSGTVEEIINRLEKSPTILSFFDESQTFFDSLGRYDGISGFDKSVYSTLFNAPLEHSRELANRITILDKPRLNLCLLGHPKEYLNLLKNEDGLVHRFIMNAPEPVFFKAADIHEAYKFNTISLSKIFFFLFKIHQKERAYTFDADSSIETVHDRFKTIIKETSSFDSFIGYFSLFIKLNRNFH